MDAHLTIDPECQDTTCNPDDYRFLPTITWIFIKAGDLRGVWVKNYEAYIAALVYSDPEDVLVKVAEADKVPEWGDSIGHGSLTFYLTYAPDGKDLKRPLPLRIASEERWRTLQLMTQEDKETDRGREEAD